MAALGGILFGYDVGIISGALLQLRDEYNLSCFQKVKKKTFYLFN